MATGSNRQLAAWSRARTIGDDEIYDYLDIDCEDCGVKFYVLPLSLDQYNAGKRYPTRCWKCRRAYDEWARIART